MCLSNTDEYFGNKKFVNFKAVTLHSLTDGLVKVISYNKQMAICMPEFPIIITKKQVMDFFGLVKPSTTMSCPPDECVIGLNYGRLIHKNEDVSAIVFKYCPICGEKFDHE